MLGIGLASASWMRVRSGIYVSRAAFTKLPPWKKYAVRVHAFVRQHPDAVLCLESAAIFHGLPLFAETKDIHVFASGRSRSRRFGDVCVHTSADPREVVQVKGALITGILDTVADLARALPPAQALAVVDSAISPTQGGWLSVDALREHIAGQQNHRGSARAGWAWGNADARAESPGESVSRAVITWTGFERPELQHRFHYEGANDRTDFYFPSCRAIGESDGWQKYQRHDPAEAARLLAEEKRREDRLRRHGHPFARWDLTDAWRVKPLERALERAGVPRVAPPQSAMLATLLRRPREKSRPPLSAEKPFRA